MPSHLWHCYLSLPKQVTSHANNSDEALQQCQLLSQLLLELLVALLPLRIVAYGILRQMVSSSALKHLETCEGRRFDEHMETKRNKGTRDLCTLDATLDATLIDLLWAANGRNQQFNFHYIFVNSVLAPNKPFFQAHFPAKYFTSCYFLTVWSLPGDTVSSSLLGNPTFSSCFCSCLCCICQANSLIHHAHHRFIWLPTS